MTTLARSSSAPAGTAAPVSCHRLRPRLRAALVLAGALLALLTGASSAGAFVAHVGSTEVGLQPRASEFILDGELGASFANASGNPVVHSSNTYAIYWDPTAHYHGDWQELIDRFLRDAGASSGELGNVFAVDEQYTDRTNQPISNHSVFKGAYHDTDAYPVSGCTDPHPFSEVDQLVIGGQHVAVCLTDAQIQFELRKYIFDHQLPQGMSSVFYVLTPPGVAMCLDGGGSTGHCSSYSGAIGSESYENSFCSYHGDINPSGLSTGAADTILYGAIPWSAGGFGDTHLTPGDRRAGFDCQDGGYDPTSDPPEEPEHAKEKTEKEKEEFEKATKEEKEKKEEEEAHEGKRIQEPNQVQCPSLDGGCDKGLADVIVGQIANEQQNIVTNPLLNAWQDVAHLEATDECRNWFAPALGGESGAKKGSLAGNLFNQELAEGSHYYLQSAFNHAAFVIDYPGVPCVTGDNLIPAFTAPNPVNVGELVSFNGMESTITLNAANKYPASGEPSTTYPTYTWDFGDGTPEVSGFAPGSPAQNSPSVVPCEAPWIAPCAGSTFHSFQYGGTYNVTLTVKDVGGNTASITNPVTVDGPGPPSPPTPPAPGPENHTTTNSSNSTSGKPGTSTGGGSGGTPQIVATQAVSSHSLSSALRSGLVVRYSVSARATGRFEVLLASSVAKKIGLHGPSATGLAKGTPAQIVIAKAILVTTKGGHSSYRIKFSKATAAKLRKLSKVSLMIRLVVHNASSPVATTVLSTATLSR